MIRDQVTKLNPMVMILGNSIQCLLNGIENQ